jgi:hypothetical protein
VIDNAVGFAVGVIAQFTIRQWACEFPENREGIAERSVLSTEIITKNPLFQRQGAP